MSSTSQYLISLCAVTQEANKTLGVAVRIGSSNPKYIEAATKLIQRSLSYSPASDTVATAFLIKLEKIQGISDLGKWLHFIPA